GVIAVHQDITARKQDEKELIALYNASSFLFKSDSLLNLVYQVVQAVGQEFDQMNCGLLLKGHSGREISLLARSGEYQGMTADGLLEGRHDVIAQAMIAGRL